jgi:alanyl-tRNA synthetase
MVPFKKYFLGEEKAPYPRATSIQKCMRAGGKHNDLDQIGRTLRHLTFFEMLGNFSFGDYFKDKAIEYAWGLVTEVLGLDPDRLWVTVHESDDEAESIWNESIGLPRERIQRLGDDNWWQMGDTGPCGPSSEIYFDKGNEYGAAGGPAKGSDERYLEIWNLVFMQYDRHENGDLTALPRPCIDTGAGLERIIPILGGHGSVFESDLMWPIVERAQSLTGASYGREERVDVGLRIMADHARSTCFLLNDGVIPGNEGRGYVLRRIIRRMVMWAQMIGARQPVAAELVDSVVSVMQDGYPELLTVRDSVKELADREEFRFRQTLKLGYSLMESGMVAGIIPGELAFRLHDTFGFPIELTQEVAAERGVEVDLAGFAVEMERQRERARKAGLGSESKEIAGSRAGEVLSAHGKTEFTGYESAEETAYVLAVDFEGDAKAVYLDRTPFYPEGGGQVGDTGTIVGSDFELQVVGTDQPVPGAIRHLVEVKHGYPSVGAKVTASVDKKRRDLLRVNHTATHLLHWALRKVLGTHVRQQGSLVAPDRLRFDFTHFGPLSADAIREVELAILEQIVSDRPVVTEIKDKNEALEEGAMAFFGDRYDQVVRVVKVGPSVELCGGTHLDRTGRIGLVKIVSESSIGADTRRIEALTGERALVWLQNRESILSEIAGRLQVGVLDAPGKLDDVLARNRDLEREVRRLNQERLARLARELASKCEGDIIVERLDGFDQAELRELSLDLVKQHGVKRVILASSRGDKAIVVGASGDPDSYPANELIEEVAKALGGGVGRQPELAISGGRKVENLDAALARARQNNA